MTNEQPLRGLRVVVSPGGTAAHLAVEASMSHLELHTLCGVPIDLGTPPHWFEDSGCKKCARHALRRGLDHITDIDGAEVNLHDVVDRTW
jgi:hypothetical protein